MKIFNFELEKNLDLHFDVKFGGESEGDDPESSGWRHALRFATN